ncbi:MAG: 50S ribosomal protein L10 [Deltaproteobacteria bacterium]|nr:MAG: 50S ribosomal protein L10 [Deltaproteobacteria bacterium]
MERAEKVRFVEDMKGRLEKAKATFLVDYKGLNVEAINNLRKELRKAGAEFQVVKNRLLKLAAQSTDTAKLQEYMKGPSAVALSYDDPVAPAKALVEFAKENEQLEIKAGQISGKLMDLDAIKRLAELPSREVLLAQTLSVMQAVPTSFVRVLNGIMLQLLYALKAIEQKKAEGA